MTDQAAFLAAVAAQAAGQPAAPVAPVAPAAPPAAAPVAPAAAPVAPVAAAPAALADVVVPAAPAAPVAPDALDEMFGELAEARATPTDPRVAFREQAVTRLMAERGLTEPLARALANTAPKRDLEAWLGGGPAVGSAAPPAGQAAQPLPTAAAAPAGQPAGSGDPLQVAFQRLQALEQHVMAGEVAKNRTEFAAAAVSLRDTFPMMLTADGRLDTRVAQAAKALLGSPVFAGQPARAVLQAAGAAVFSGLAPTGSVPTPTPTTPVSTGTAGRPQALGLRDQFATFVNLAQAAAGPSGQMSQAQWNKVQEQFSRALGNS